MVAEAAHGEAGKRLILRLGIREAAKTEIVRILAGRSELARLRRRLEGDVVARRKAINELDRMGRHVRAIELDRTQDFDGAVVRLRSVLGPEIEWELRDGVRTLREKLSVAELGSMHSARFLRRHAPTRLASGPSRWWEGAPVIGWLVAVWDRLQDRPLPVRTHR